MLPRRLRSGRTVWHVDGVDGPTFTGCSQLRPALNRHASHLRDEQTADQASHRCTNRTQRAPVVRPPGPSAFSPSGRARLGQAGITSASRATGRADDHRADDGEAGAHRAEGHVLRRAAPVTARLRSDAAVGARVRVDAGREVLQRGGRFLLRMRRGGTAADEREGEEPAAPEGTRRGDHSVIVAAPRGAPKVRRAAPPIGRWPADGRTAIGRGGGSSGGRVPRRSAPRPARSVASSRRR
jgi:hypothetical protein